jgi:hypothetical protein
LLTSVRPFTTIRQVTVPSPRELTRATEPDRTTTDRLAVDVPLVVRYSTRWVLRDLTDVDLSDVDLSDVDFPDVLEEPVVSSGSQAVSTSATAPAATTTRVLSMARACRSGRDRSVTRGGGISGAGR